MKGTQVNISTNRCEPISPALVQSTSEGAPEQQQLGNGFAGDGETTALSLSLLSDFPLAVLFPVELVTADYMRQYLHPIKVHRSSQKSLLCLPAQLQNCQEIPGDRPLEEESRTGH